MKAYNKKTERLGALELPCVEWRIDEPVSIGILQRPQGIRDPLLALRMKFHRRARCLGDQKGFRTVATMTEFEAGE